MLFFPIILANLNRFLPFYIVLIVKKKEILHATIIKFITSPDLCAHLTWKIKTYIFAVVPKT